MKKNNVVYLHRKVTDNSIFYVGIGNKKRPFHFRGRNNLWHKIFKKYGCFVDVIKTGLTRNEAISIEKLLIDYYGKIKNDSGILSNMTDGGDGITRGYKHDDKFKEKRRKIMIGNTNTKGMKLSTEHKNKISKSSKGRKAWNKGVKIKEEVRLKIIENSKRGSENHYSCRVFVEGKWFETMNDAGKFISNRTTVLNRCKSPKWNYYREGHDDPKP